MSGRHKATATISVDAPRLLLKYARSRGVALQELCKSVGLDPAVLQQPAGRISFQQFTRLWEAVSAHLGDPALELHFGEVLPDMISSHLLYVVMMNSATLWEALERLCRYHGLLLDKAAPQIWDDGERRVFALGNIESFGQPYGEAVLTMLNCTVDKMTENRVRPVEVWLAHPPPPDISEYHRIFAAPLVFDRPGYRLIYHREALNTPNWMANPAFLAELDQFAEQQLTRLSPTGAWTRRVTEMVADLVLKQEKPHLSTVAHALALSPRALQNYLLAEGTTYQQVVDEVRFQIARDSLSQKGMTFSEVAFLVGFSEQSAFNHAFKRWTGMTPSDYSGH